MRLLKPVKFIAQRLRQSIKARGVVPRADDPYATCVPVLVGIAKPAMVQRVLEFGSGLNSTVLFLNTGAFPDLQEIRSYENDRDWAERVAQVTRDDSRLRLEVVDTAMHEAAATANYEGYDLVFIDDSTNAVDRSKTIEAVFDRKSVSNIVVIHDMEVPEYRSTISALKSSFENQFLFTALTPNTGIFWDERRLSRLKLGRWNRAIKKHAGRIPPSDVSAWIDLKQRHG